MEITSEQLIAILQTSLGVFRDEIDPDISAARILTLLAVAKNPGMQQVDAANHIKGLSQSAISRNVLDWTELTSARKAGPEFVVQRPDPAYRKRNLLFPTTKGFAFLNRLTAIVNGAATKTPKGSH